MSSLPVGLPILIPCGDLTGSGLALSHLVLMTFYSVNPPVTWLQSFLITAREIHIGYSHA